MSGETEGASHAEAEGVERAGIDGESGGSGRSSSGGPRLNERLAAVERALTGSDRPVSDVDGIAAAADERDAFADRLDAVEAQIEDLEAATQAVRGYAGAIRAVNREVERRADLALARATAARDGPEPHDNDAHDDRGMTDEGPRTEADGAERPGDASGGLPNDDALDAALPEDRRAGTRETSGRRADRVDRETRPSDGLADGDGVGGRSVDGDDDGADLLERLREAL